MNCKTRFLSYNIWMLDFYFYINVICIFIFLSFWFQPHILAWLDHFGSWFIFYIYNLIDLYKTSKDVTYIFAMVTVNTRTQNLAKSNVLWQVSGDSIPGKIYLVCDFPLMSLCVFTWQILIRALWKSRIHYTSGIF